MSAKQLAVGNWQLVKPKTGKTIPRINADEHGLDRHILGSSSGLAQFLGLNGMDWDESRGEPISENPKSNPKTFETRRNGGSGGRAGVCPLSLPIPRSKGVRVQHPRTEASTQQSALSIQPRKTKPKTFETQRNGEFGGKTGEHSPLTSREEPRPENASSPQTSTEGRRSLMDIHQAGMVEKHQHQAVDQRYLGKRLKIKEAEPGRGWHEGCNSLGNGKVSRDAADLDPSFGASALIQDDGA